MEKIKKGRQLSFINSKGAGRPKIHDLGIRHSARPLIKKPTSLHLTIKVKKNKADIKNKSVLSIMKRAIVNARKSGLKVIHYSLEYDHIHLLIEADNNIILGKGMQAFGVTLAKAINRLRKLKGQVYKHRYHFRQITSARDLKNVMRYIFNNGVKHKTAKSMINQYNSIKAEMKAVLFTKEKFTPDFELIRLLDQCQIFYSGVGYT